MASKTGARESSRSALATSSRHRDDHACRVCLFFARIQVMNGQIPVRCGGRAIAANICVGPT
jgi:hypothetical protein